MFEGVFLHSLCCLGRPVQNNRPLHDNRVATDFLSALANNLMDAGRGESDGSGHSPQLTEERKDTKVGGLGQ